MMTPEEVERLACLLEECGEAIHMAGKVLRHGYDSSHPDYANVPNRNNLSSEVGNIKACIMVLESAGDLRDDWVKDGLNTKLANLQRFLHHQANKKIVSDLRMARL